MERWLPGWLLVLALFGALAVSVVAVWLSVAAPLPFDGAAASIASLVAGALAATAGTVAIGRAQALARSGRHAAALTLVAPLALTGAGAALWLLAALGWISRAYCGL